MNSIAVFLNPEGLTASPQEEGIIRVYSQNPVGGSWEAIKEFEFSPAKSSSISELRKMTLAMIQRLDGCRIFTAREVAGQLYSVLEANRFSIYEVEGKPEQFLDSILASEKQENKNPADESAGPPKCYPEKTDAEGSYFMNLKAALNSDPNLTSKKILLPFFKDTNFKVLEIICEHIPRWFYSELEKLGLQFTESRLGENEYKAVVTVK
jgi:Fe-only nitrogenase accessory protein AnfO